MTVKISASLFKAKLQKDKSRFVIDVRGEGEYNAGHVSGAHHYPLDQLDHKVITAKLEDEKDLDDCVYILCHSGKRAEMAAGKLKAEGGLDVIVIEGGTQACKKIQMEISKPVSSIISLERQVRIAAGSIIVLGMIFGFTFDVRFHYLSGFVGAGLVFAGLSNFCMMGVILSKMPWNK